MSALSPRESTLADFLRSPDTVENAMELVQNTHILNYLTDTTPQQNQNNNKDHLSDVQRLQVLKRLLQYSQLWDKFATFVTKLWKPLSTSGRNRATAEKFEEQANLIQPVLELLLSLDGDTAVEARSNLITADLLKFDNFAWMLKQDLKTANLLTKLLCETGVKERVELVNTEEHNSQDFSLLVSAQTEDDEKKFRYLQLVADLISADVEVPKSAFQLLVQAYFTEDILLKLNAVQLFEQLGTSRYGRKLLLTENLPNLIKQELTEGDNMQLSLDPKIAPMCVLFCCFILQQEPENYFNDLYEQLILKYVEEFLAAPNTNEIAKLCLLKMFGAVFQVHFPNSQKNAVVESNWVEFAKGAIAKSTNPEICKAGLVAWIIATTSTEKNQESKANLKIAPHVIRPALELLTKQSLNAELRPFLYQLLANLACDFSCARMLIESDEIRQILLDFGSETTHDGRVEKHLFVKNLLEKTEVCRQLLDEQGLEMLELYVRKGPYGAVGSMMEARVQVGQETA
ncbi:unnamed protein product [Amoebophrya sp. A120]|nr:unnamed protein product [Amoebophrya sp. A120]CAD7960966.1 unnamed protein product [Amoebophrya sp. A120]|eukprot:GSA120T00025210001.1